jgi:hypothetical protein
MISHKAGFMSLKPVLFVPEGITGAAYASGVVSLCHAPLKKEGIKPLAVSIAGFFYALAHAHAAGLFPCQPFFDFVVCQQ